MSVAHLLHRDLTELIAAIANTEPPADSPEEELLWALEVARKRYEQRRPGVVPDPKSQD